MASPLIGALCAGGITLANVGIRLFEEKLNYDDVKNGKHSEVAYIYEAQRALGPS